MVLGGEDCLKILFWIRALWFPNFEASFFVFVFLFAFVPGEQSLESQKGHEIHKKWAPSVIICSITASPSKSRSFPRRLNYIGGSHATKPFTRHNQICHWVSKHPHTCATMNIECQSWRRSSAIRRRWKCSTALAAWFLTTPCGLFRNRFLRPLSNLCRRVLFTEARGKSVEPVWLPRL